MRSRSGSAAAGPSTPLKNTLSPRGRADALIRARPPGRAWRVFSYGRWGRRGRRPRTWGSALPCAVLMLAAFATAALAQSPQAQAAQEPATVEGVITNALTGEPVLRAHVQLRSWGPTPGRYGALTDAQGKFSIKGLPPADYSLLAERVGFVTTGNRPEDRVTLKPGENRRDLNLKLTPTGAISGRVTGAGGEPMAFVQVTGIGRSGEFPARTDEKGEFRIGGLRPGKYRVRASPFDPPLPPEIRTDGTTETHYVPTYYPNSIERRSGARVQVSAGRETGGIEIALASMPIVCVSGRVSGIPPGTEHVYLSSRAADGLGKSVAVQPDGSFQLWRSVPGRHTLVAVSYGPDGENMRSGPVEIEVGAANIENVEPVLIPPFDISGRVQIEDASVQETAARGRAGPVREPALSLEPFDRMGPGVKAAGISADGSFKLEKVPPGRFRVRLFGRPGYVRAMRLGEMDIDGAVLDVRHGSGGAELLVFVSTETGELSGTIRDENGNPVAATVALLSFEADDVRSWPVTFATSGEKGEYKLRQIAPGRYKVVVLPKSGSYTSLWPSEDEQDAAEIIEIRANDKLTKDLTLPAQEDP